MSNLAVREQGHLHSMSDMEKMAQVLSASGMFSFKKPGEVLACMLLAQAEGLHPATVVREFDLIQGRPALKSQAALARFQRDGGRIQWLERTDQRCRAKFFHPAGGELEVMWDMARAKAMGLDGKDNWRKQPMVMLSWRVVAEGVRTIAPGCLGGQYLVEEVQDFAPPSPPRRLPSVTEVEVFAPAPGDVVTVEGVTVDGEVIPAATYTVVPETSQDAPGSTEPPAPLPRPSPSANAPAMASEAQQKLVHFLANKAWGKEEGKTKLAATLANEYKALDAEGRPATKCLTRKQASEIVDALKKLAGE